MQLQPRTDSAWPKRSQVQRSGACLTVFLVCFGALLGCSADETESDGTTGDVPPSGRTVLPATAAIEGYEAERDTWRAFCESVGDPITTDAVTEAGGTASQVVFDERTADFGLPTGVFTSSASAGRLGDRAAIFVPGFTDATQGDRGNPYLELFVRCGARFHPVGLDGRLDGFAATDLEESLTSGIWDVDGDGRSDLILPYSDEVEQRYFVAVFYNEGNGRFRFEEGPQVRFDATLNTVTPVDFDRDGILDMYTSMMGENFHNAVAGVGDTQARDNIMLFGSNRVWEDVTGDIPGLTGAGDLTTFSFVCVPELPDGRRGRLCWVGTGHVNDYVLEEVGPLDFRVVAGLDLPDNATMGVSAIDSWNGADTTFIATNIGRPLLVRVTDTSTVSVVSDEIPMEELVIDNPPRMGADRPRVGWGVALEQFNNSGCPGFVIGNTQIGSLSFLPIFEGAGVLYYERDCRPEAPLGTQFENRSAGAGALFQDDAISDYFQTIVTYVNDDLCPDLIMTTYPRDAEDPSRLLNDPTELRAIINRCDTPGNRVAFQLVPADYSARVVVTDDQGIDHHGYLAQPGQAGTNDQIISIALGERTATRACVHWGQSSRWPTREPQCVDSPSTTQLTVMKRPVK